LSKIDSSEFTGLNPVIGWYLGLRWTACALVFFALACARLLVRYVLPYRTLFALSGALLAVNLALTVYHHLIRRENLSRSEIGILFHIQVCCDYVLLLLLVYFSGNLENPFAFFFVFHVMLTSFIFRAEVVYAYAVTLVAVLTATVVAESVGLLPHFPLNAAAFDPVAYRTSVFARAVGLFFTLLVSAYLVTSIKSRIEERGRRIEVELNRYRDLDRAKSDFILLVTHELRGPLAALAGYHEMILKGITGEVGERTRETILRADRRTENLLTMIDEMIDFAYMKSGEEVRHEKRSVAVKEAIDYNVDLFARQAAAKGITLTSNCPREPVIWASRDLLNIILSNLIGNAIKYSPRGSAVAVNCAVEGDDVHLLVRDEGIGIESEELDKVFEEFYRTRRARELERDGTGLGLPIVQRAVETLNGRITVYSEADKGTTFHVYLPRRPSDASQGGG